MFVAVGDHPRAGTANLAYVAPRGVIDLDTARFTATTGLGGVVGGGLEGSGIFVSAGPLDDDV
jgi:hypothetical protein